MSNKEIIAFIYYLLDKIDEVYLKEVEKRVERFIDNLTKK